MPPVPTTLSALLACLETVSADAPVVFQTEAAEIRGGYHVTELRHARIDGVDCGGRRAAWREASIEILDGDLPPAYRMTARKLTSILQKSLATLPDLGDAPLHIAWAPGNTGLSRYAIRAVAETEAGVEIALTASRAVCKPASTGCCG